MASETDLTPAEIRDALARVLESPEFSQAARLSAFLRYVVTEALEGREAGIKGYSIAIDVFERSPDFDQNADPIVRVEASRLRRALAQYYQGSGAADPVIIELPRGGYVPAFRRRSGAEAVAVQPEPEAAEPEPSEEDAPPPAGLAPGIRRFRAVVLTGMGLAVAALAFLVWDAVQRDTPAPPSPSPTTAIAPPEDAQHRPTVAVAPLESLGPETSDSTIARGLTNEIVAQLTRFREIIVFPVESGSPRLAHGYLLSGSLAHAGNNIRVTVQLTDAARGETVWSQTYDRHYAVDDLLNLQRDIARSVATTVAQPYGAVYERERERAAANPKTMEAYACVMRAYEYWRTLDPAEHRAVRDCLEATVKREPQFASAWYALTFIYLDEYRYSYNLRPDNGDPRDKALAAAQQAVALAPTDARAYEALYAAYFFRGDMEGFRRAGNDALRLNPNNPEIIADYGNRLALSGAWDEGIALVKRAMDLNPGHPGWYQIPLVLDAYRRGNYAEALALTERMNMPKFYRSWVFLAMIHGQLGDAARASAALDQANRLNPAFQSNVRDEMRRWGYQPDLIEACIEGLRKAGLTIPDAG